MIGDQGLGCRAGQKKRPESCARHFFSMFFSMFFSIFPQLFFGMVYKPLARLLTPGTHALRSGAGATPQKDRRESGRSR